MAKGMIQVDSSKIRYSDDFICLTDMDKAHAVELGGFLLGCNFQLRPNLWVISNANLGRN